MKGYTKLYMDLLDYGTEDFIGSELSGLRAVDIHHLFARKAGGTKRKESICNLMALTREEHEKYGDKKKYIEFLIDRHFEFLRMRQTDRMLDHIITRAMEGCELSKRYLDETTN